MCLDYKKGRVSKDPIYIMFVTCFHNSESTNVFHDKVEFFCFMLLKLFSYLEKETTFQLLLKENVKKKL